MMQTKMIEDSIHPLKFCRLGTKVIPESYKENAKNRLSETEEKLSEGIRIIKEMIKDRNLAFHENDAYITRFLRFRKYDVERTIDTMLYHMEMASTVEQKVGFPNPEEMHKVFKHNLMGILPYHDQDGRPIMFGQNAGLLFDTISPKEVMHGMLVTSFYAIQDPATQINGLTLILDAKDMNFQHISGYIECMRLNLMILKCNPGGFKRVDIFNTGVIARLLLKVARPFLPFKLGQRVHFHDGGPSGLLDHYKPEILPTEFGGTLGSLSNAHWMEQVEPTCNLIRDYILKYSNLKSLK